MDAKYNRYKWADAEIMKKDKQSPLRHETKLMENKNSRQITRVLDYINKL